MKGISKRPAFFCCFSCFAVRLCADNIMTRINKNASAFEMVCMSAVGKRVCTEVLASLFIDCWNSDRLISEVSSLGTHFFLILFFLRKKLKMLQECSDT